MGISGILDSLRLEYAQSVSLRTGIEKRVQGRISQMINKDISTLVSIIAVVGGIALTILVVLAGMPLLEFPLALIAFLFGSTMLLLIVEATVYSIYLKIKTGNWAG